MKSERATTLLEIQLLGDFRLSCANKQLDSVNSPRLQALFAYLILHREAPQARQHVAFQLWPDSTEAHARANLRFHLHQLRRALPQLDHLLEADDEALRWREDISCKLDVADFEGALRRADQARPGGNSSELRAALEQAVALYRGDLLPSCYDDWILPERERLRQILTGTLEQLVELLEQQGDYRAAINFAQHLLRHDPLHELTYRRLMRLYALSGDRVGALRTHQTCVAVLQRELGVEPSIATREEYERLLRKELPSAPPTAGDAATISPARSPGGLPPGTLPPGSLPPGSLPHNLPVQPTSFIGREHELAELKSMLGKTRLLTLTGAGGSGKTRLALQVSAELARGDEPAPELYADGIWWVELAALTEPSLVLKSIASLLGVSEEPAKPLMRTLSEHIKTKRMLLLLDNCEHLIRACAQVVKVLLRNCPQLHVLITSREPLNIASEVTWLVPLLSLPGEAGTPSAIMQSEAVHLFMERAQSTLPTFRLTALNAATVAQICRRLEGMPLAIELAAARVKVLSPGQIAARLDDAFRLLTRGNQDATARHQTLRAAMDWSYELLSPEERVLFRRLSVFAGGFTLEAAEEVCGDQDGAGAKGGSYSRVSKAKEQDAPATSVLYPSEVLDLLSNLVDKSLVTVSDWGRGEQAHYRLLEPIRLYARDRLFESGESNALRDRHVEHVLRLAEEAEPELERPQMRIWLERLEREHDNLRSALEWSPNKGADTALRLAGALRYFWYMRGYIAEGSRWLSAALSQSGGSMAGRAKAVNGLGLMEYARGDYTQAIPHFEESLALYKELGPEGEVGVALALGNIGSCLSILGDHTRAVALIEECLARSRALGDKPGIAVASGKLADAEYYRGNYDRAFQLYEETLSLFRQLGDRHATAINLHNLGAVARLTGKNGQARLFFEESLVLFRELQSQYGTAQTLDELANMAREQGDYAQARSLYREALAVFRDLGYQRESTVSLAAFASVTLIQDQLELAARLLGAVEGLCEASGAPLPLEVQAEYEQNRAAARAKLGEAKFVSAWGQGRGMTKEQAIELALGSPPP